MTNLDVVNKIIEFSDQLKITPREVIKGAMKVTQFLTLSPEEIIELLNNKYIKLN